MAEVRKRRKSYNEPGHAHESTFSCYRRLPLFKNDGFKRLFLKSLDRARRKHGFEVWAFVIMPEHVHILAHPLRQSYSVAEMLRSIKQPVAQIALPEIRENAPVLARSLLASERGKETYRFWQAGGGYGRNLYSPEAIHTCIDYLHANPARRRLCDTPLEWLWSSARWYAGLESVFEVDRCQAVLTQFPGGR